MKHQQISSLQLVGYIRLTLWPAFITATYCKYIVWIGRQPPSLGRVVLLLATTQICKHSVYKPRCLAISWCTVSTRFATWVSPASIRIHYLKNFDSELVLINAGLILSPVSFSGRGEKLLERNKRPGHNFRQYGKSKWGFNLISYQNATLVPFFL